MRDATFSRRDFVSVGGALAVGVAVGKPTDVAAAPPSANGPKQTSWADSALPEVVHRTIETNGIRLHVAAQGEGPLIILCHGFPECWYSWRHQLPALAKAGFHAVAPDLRGYGRSERPEDVEKYTILDDIGDIVSLVDTLGAEQAVIVGHDIGPTIAWQTALMRPDIFRACRCDRARLADRGRQRRSCREPRMHFSTSSSSKPRRLRWLSGHDLRGTFRGQFYALSGDRPPPAGGGFAGGMVPRERALLPDPASLPAWVAESDIDVYVKEFTRSGFHGPLAW